MTRFMRLSDDDPRDVGGYPIRARLGGGGMGQVYLSFTRGGRPVAVKVVHVGLAEDPVFRRRFRREIETIQRVHGLYTAPVLDADPDAPRPWLATAYVAGPSLHEAIDEHGPLPPLVTARLLAGCAEALASIHAAGLVHRDLKPANVLLAEDGPRVIDFGIARAADASTLTRSGVVIGTPAFMAPEQITGGQITAAADVFSLGLTAYYAATATSAYGEGTAQAVMYRIANQQPDLERCPAELRPILEACLSREPEQRPAPSEIMDMAGALLRHGPEQAGGWLPSEIATTMAGFQPPAELRPATGDVPTQPAYNAPTYPTPVPGAPTYPAPLTPGYPARSSTVRTPLLIGAGVVALVIVAAVVGTVLATAHGGSRDPRSGSTTGQGASPTRFGGGITQEYAAVSFSFPGTGISGVNFTQHGPEVSTDPSETMITDFTYYPEADPSKLRPYDSVQMAPVDGTPDGAACRSAVTRNPIGDVIRYADLKVGSAFCLLNSLNQQLAYIRLTAKPSSSYRLTWTATGWLVPGD